MRSSVDSVYYKQQSKSKLKGDNIGTAVNRSLNSEEAKKKTRDLTGKQKSLKRNTNSKLKNLKMSEDRIEVSGSFNPHNIDIEQGISVPYAP